MRDERFDAPEARVTWFSNVILSAIASPEAPLRVLDVGCGAGDQIFDLATRLPRAHFTGIDISAPNVALARQRIGSDHPRVTFELGDYVTWRPQAPFDIVLSYSVLYLVEGDTAVIARRLVSDVAPGGLFINVMPNGALSNHVLEAVRRLMRRLRSPLSDRLVLTVARLLHGRGIDEELLLQRLPYAYLVPCRHEEALADAVESLGLETVRRERVARASPAQLSHTLRIMRVRN